MNTALAGQTIRIIQTYNANLNYLEGAEIELTCPALEDLIFVDDRHGWVSCPEWELVLPEPNPDRYTMPDSMADMVAEIERLTKALAYEKEQHAATKADRDDIISDFAIVSDLLLEEAQDRDWCEEYDTFVDQVNKRTKKMSLQNCQVEYEVIVQRVRTVYDQVTVTVEGRRGMDEYDLQDSAFELAQLSWDWHEVDDDVSDDYEIMDMRES